MDDVLKGFFTHCIVTIVVMLVLVSIHDMWNEPVTFASLLSLLAGAAFISITIIMSGVLAWYIVLKD